MQPAALIKKSKIWFVSDKDLLNDSPIFLFFFFVLCDKLYLQKQLFSQMISFLQQMYSKLLYQMFLYKSVIYIKFIDLFTRQTKFPPVDIGSHPVDTSHIPSSQSQTPWHLCPYKGYVHLIVQFIPTYPGIHAGIHIRGLVKNFLKKCLCHITSIKVTTNTFKYVFLLSDFKRSMFCHHRARSHVTMTSS